MPPIRPTLQTIADAMGVSAMTVSLALRNSPRISVAKRKQIQAHAEKIGYQQNSFAASLVSLRTQKHPKYQATLALLNCYASRAGWRQYANLTRMFEGVCTRAKELGYLVEEFWLNEPDMSVDRLRRTLVSRGIPGILMAFIPDRDWELHRLREFDFRGFACASLGWRLEEMNIHSCSNDQYHTGLLAAHKLIERGYRRIGLILNEGLDTAIEHRLRAGYTMAMQDLPKNCRPPAYAAAVLNRESFVQWIRKNRLDAILALPAGVHRWVLEEGWRIPEDIGFAYLDCITPADGLAGIDQKSELVGSAAVDMVVALLHRNESGIPPYQKSMLIRGEWVQSWSVRNPPGV